MALKIGKNVPSGFVCEYWAITAIVADFSKGKVHVALAGFKDQAARIAKSEPGGSAKAEIDIPGDTSRAELYKTLKALKEFEGAEDC